MDLVNGLGIAQRLGVGAACVAQWRTRHEDFPQPLDLPGVVGIPIWRWADVERWHAQRGR